VSRALGLKRRALWLALLVMTGAAVWYYRGHVSAEEVDALIAREIPPGSSSEDVEVFLRANGMTYSGIVETDVISDFRSYPGKKRVISASLKGIRVGSLLSDGIFINFLFDTENRLIDYRVQESYTWM
jgi:hypothetical protein